MGAGEAGEAVGIGEAVGDVGGGLMGAGEAVGADLMGAEGAAVEAASVTVEVSLVCKSCWENMGVRRSPQAKPAVA